METKKATEELLQEYRKGIADSISRWKDINENGCNDPFWGDGVNMNLARAHVLYYKNLISGLVSEKNISFPEEYYLPTPPAVPGGYMANLEQKERVNRLMLFWDGITTDKQFYDDKQLSFV